MTDREAALEWAETFDLHEHTFGGVGMSLQEKRHALVLARAVRELQAERDALRARVQAIGAAEKSLLEFDQAYRLVAEEVEGFFARIRREAGLEDNDQELERKPVNYAARRPRRLPLGKGELDGTD